MWHNFKVTKRVAPAITYNFFENPSTGPNIQAGSTIYFVSPEGFGLRYRPVVTADAVIISSNEQPGITQGPWTADAEI